MAQTEHNALADVEAFVFMTIVNHDILNRCDPQNPLSQVCPFLCKPHIIFCVNAVMFGKSLWFLETWKLNFVFGNSL